MSGSLKRLTPHGRGLKTSFRCEPVGVDRAAGPRKLYLDWRSIPKQAAILAPDAGIDFAITGVGGGKSKIAAAKMLAWALRRPRRPDGSATLGLVLGRDYKLVRRVQLEYILEHARRLFTLAPGDADALLAEFGAIDRRLRAKPPAHEGAALLQRRSEIVVPFPYEAVVKRVVGGLDPRIILWNGVELHGLSGTDPNRLRGPGFDFAWQDEAEWQSEDAFTIALSRQRSADAIRMIVTSTPNGADSGWIWRVISGEYPEWDDLRRKAAIRVHRWSSRDNPTNSEGVLATIGAALDASRPGMSQQELDGLFVGTHESPGAGPFIWARAFSGPIALTAREARAAVLGVDLAQKQDFTWLTVLSEAGVVLAMERFNESTVAVGPESFFPFVEQRIVALIEQWRIPLVKMDTAWTGASQAQFLVQHLNGRAKVEGFKTDQQTKKDEAIEALGAAMSRGSVRVPTLWTGPDGEKHAVAFVEQFRLEFAKLITETVGLKRHFKHPVGGHDDGVVSLALAWQGVAQKPNPNGPNRYGPLPPPPSPYWDEQFRRRFSGPRMSGPGSAGPFGSFPS